MNFLNLNTTLWTYFLKANLSIQFVLIVLLSASLVTWTFVIQRSIYLKRLNSTRLDFEEQFWSGIQLTELYDSLDDTIPPEYLAAIFHAGFTEFCRLRNSGCQTLSVILEGVSRAMRISHAQATLNLERPLSWLAIVSMSSPYVGFLGSLLGIISVLGSLSKMDTVLFVILPGLIDALNITIVSLLTAIPALVFYYHYVQKIELLLNQYRIFQDEFIALLLRQAYEEHYEKSPLT